MVERTTDRKVSGSNSANHKESVIQLGVMGRGPITNVKYPHGEEASIPFYLSLLSHFIIDFFFQIFMCLTLVFFYRSFYDILRIVLQG